MQNNHQIMEGNCVDILATLPEQSADLVVTDPPYLVNYRDRSGRSIANDDNAEAVLSAFPGLYRVLKPNSMCICFYGWTKIDKFFNAWKQGGFTPVGHIVWSKNYASRTGYLRARHEQAYLLAKGNPQRPSQPIDDVRSWVYSGNRRHPTEKAVSILTPLVEAFSRPGDLVLDPFAGSGSTVVAAALKGRRSLGIELEASYCELARRRLSGVARYQCRTSSG